jgi:hypothetical protein
VTKIVYLVLINLSTPKARAKHEPFVQQTGLRYRQKLKTALPYCLLKEAFGPNSSRQNDMLPFFPKSVAEKNSLKRQVKKGLSSIVALGMGAGVGSKQVRGLTCNTLFY